MERCGRTCGAEVAFSLTLTAFKIGRGVKATLFLSVRCDLAYAGWNFKRKLLSRRYPANAAPVNNEAIPAWNLSSSVKVVVKDLAPVVAAKLVGPQAAMVSFEPI